MREINECKAEIFRRSENRIKKRRIARVRIAVFSVSLSLIITVCSVVFLPSLLPENKANNTSNITNIDSEVATKFTSLKVESQHQNSENIVITDEQSINSAHSIIIDLFSSNSQENAGVSEDKIYSYSSGTLSVQDAFSIYFTTTAGNKIEYKLVGNELHDINNDIHINLSTNQVLKLKRTLGLAD